MLAKVLKSEAAVSSIPFTVPTIGQAKPSSVGINEFVLPTIDPFEFAHKTFETLSTTDPAANDILQQARDEAAKIIAQAEEQSAMIEQITVERTAHETSVTLETEVAEKVADMRLRLAETIAKISAVTNQLSDGVESDLVELAIQIAKKIVGREVTIDREIALTLVKVSLGKLHNRMAAKVHLNPEDFAFVKAHIERLDFRDSLEIIEDRSVSVGGCLIHTETGDIDARIESQFDEISHGLLN